MERTGYFFEGDPGYGVEADPEEFEYPDFLLRLIDNPQGPKWLQDYLRSLDRKTLAGDSSVARAALTKDDPLLFALVYLSHHLYSVETGDKLSFAEFHLDLLEHAKEWLEKARKPREHRNAYVAPRGCGKSTWLFLLLPVWAAAHKHVKFIVAFSDSAEQSKNHLATIRGEFDTNDLLQQDFANLCEPKVRRPGGPVGKKLVASRTDMIEQANGFIMVAKGSGTAARGLKVGKLRPDLIVLDDIEPGEEKYSPTIMRHRLRWMLETVFHLNEFARVVIVGTVTAPGSIMHQLVEFELHPEENEEEWIEDQNISVHYYEPIILDDDGTERSCWPGKWTLEYLKKHEHTKEYKKEFLNQPVSLNGTYWSDEDFTYADLPTVRTALTIDPAVTSHANSHDTGIAIVGLWHPKAGLRLLDETQVPEKLQGSLLSPMLVVKFATRVRLSPQKLRESVLWYLEQWPEINEVVVETNQGRDTWTMVFHHMPVRVRQTWSALPKPVRLTRLLNLYQRGKVVHARPIPRLEQQQCAYDGSERSDEPDIIDAVEIGARHFLTVPKQLRGGTYSYGRRTPVGVSEDG
jgi:hypothetical protein